MYGIIELLIWGRKSKAYQRILSSKKRRCKRSSSRLVLNERAWLRLSGKLFDELPRDEAISVLNAIKQCGK